MKRRVLLPCGGCALGRGRVRREGPAAWPGGRRLLEEGRGGRWGAAVRGAYGSGAGDGRVGDGRLPRGGGGGGGGIRQKAQGR